MPISCLVLSAWLLGHAAVPSALRPGQVQSKQEKTRFVLRDFSGAGVDDAFKPGDIVRSFLLDYHNGTRDEVESVDVRFWIEEKGKTTFQQGPIRVRRFFDWPLANWGGAMPGHLAVAEPIRIQHPSHLWNPDSHDHFEIVAVHFAKGTPDLHDIGHLYAWLKRTPEEEIVRTIRADPSIALAKNESGMTALGVAFAGSTVRVIETMIAMGAPFEPILRVRNGQGQVMHLAATNENAGPLAYLKAKGQAVDAESTSKQTALDIALDNGRFDNARWLLANGADPNHLDVAGNPPSFYAMRREDDGWLEILVKGGANLGYHTAAGYGIMQMAVQSRFATTTLLGKLLQRGLSVDDVDPKVGLTPLMVAAQNQRNDKARWLLAYGADLKARDAKGQTVFDYARRSNTLRTDMFFRREVIAKMPKAPPVEKGPKKP